MKAPTERDRLATQISEAARTADHAAHELRRITIAAVTAGLPISRAARHAGVTRPTIYRWLDQ